MPEIQPQPVLAPLTPAAVFLVATIVDGQEAVVHDALPDISGLVRAIGFRDPAKRLSAITSIGSHAWDRLFSGPRPAELHPFREISGGRHHAPATDGDLLFHIRAESMDVCFELATRLAEAMSGAIEIVDETHGFKFFDNRDLMGGFVDGTENRTVRWPARPPRSAMRTPISPAAAMCTCRSTCTTCRRGTRCRWRSRSG